jgi:hypothetical protein
MIQMVLRGIVTVFTFLALLTPIVVLSFVEERRTMLAVIVVCTGIAAAGMAVTTNCREHEIMVATST